MADVPPPPGERTADVLAQWQCFTRDLAPDVAIRPVILESWRRCRAAGVDPEPGRAPLRHVPDEELAQRLAANAELVELARPHLEWLSSVYAALPHVAYVVDRDGIVLHSTGTDREGARAAGILPGYDWSEAAMGTNGAGTALLAGEPLMVEGAEHFARPWHGYTCTGAPLRGPGGEVVGAIDVSTGVVPGGAERLDTVAHVAYAIGQELHYRDSLRCASDDLAAKRLHTKAVLRESEVRYAHIAAHVPGMELHRATQRLEESEARFRSLFDHNPDAVFSLDTEGRYLSANPACELVTGYPPDELLGRSFEPFIDPEDLDAVSAAFRTTVGGSATCFEAGIRHRSGRRVELSVTGLPIIVGRRVVGVFGIAKDLTATRMLEQQLRQAQKMEAVGRLAGGVAHDFNNLLTVIQSYSAFAVEQLPADAPARADLAEVCKAADRAAALTRQLLAFSRQQVLKPRRLDLNATVSGLAGMLRRLIGEDIRIETHLAPAVWPVLADPGQLEQVLVNLAVNARDAMPGGGTLRLRTDAVTIDERSARERPGLDPGEYTTLVVEDTGVGIEPAVLQNIFEPFYTTKGAGKGTGLGLATVYGIIEQSGGHIYADSAPGKGCRFMVFLPRLSGSDAVEDDTSSAPALQRGCETILLVEDDPSVRAVVRRQLERLGYTVREAAQGGEALEIASAPEERIDLMLTDVVMPGLSARALVEQLAAHRPGLRTVYMSGYTDDEILRRGLMQPGATYLEKPFTHERLAAALREALDRPRSVSDRAGVDAAQMPET